MELFLLCVVDQPTNFVTLIFVFLSCVSKQIKSEKYERNTAGKLARLRLFLSYFSLWTFYEIQLTNTKIKMSKTSQLSYVARVRWD